MWTPHHAAHAEQPSPGLGLSFKEHPGNHMVWLDIRYEPALSTVRV